MSQSISESVVAGSEWVIGSEDVYVTRVAVDGSWADIKVFQVPTGAEWSKRMPLRPVFRFPDDWERVG